MKKIWESICSVFKFGCGVLMLLFVGAFITAIVQGCGEILTEPIDAVPSDSTSTLVDSISASNTASLYDCDSAKSSKKSKNGKNKVRKHKSHNNGLTPGTCNALTKKGYPCMNRVKSGEYYCWRHK